MQIVLFQWPVWYWLVLSLHMWLVSPVWHLQSERCLLLVVDPRCTCPLVEKHRQQAFQQDNVLSLLAERCQHCCFCLLRHFQNTWGNTAYYMLHVFCIMLLLNCWILVMHSVKPCILHNFRRPPSLTLPTQIEVTHGTVSPGRGWGFLAAEANHSVKALRFFYWIWTF